MGGFLIILIVAAAAWLLFVLPARRRRSAHESMQDSVEVGDEIITAGGMHGTVAEMHDDTVRVEVAPAVVVTLDRRAIAARATEIEIEVEADESPGAGTTSEPR